MIKNNITHVALVIDKSSSMMNVSDTLIKVVDAQVQYLASRSTELNQETRISIYLFSDKTECLVYDIDVLRLPSIKSYYKLGGNTALIDATLLAISDLRLLPEKYGEHGFLLFSLTDGENNASNNTADHLKKTINELPDNWTVAALVPDQNGVFEAKRCGFPANNVQVWDTTKKGMEEAGKVIQRATDNYMVSRTKGIKSTKNLFNIDAAALKENTVKNLLTELNTYEYTIIPVYTASEIRKFVNSKSAIPFKIGNSYYQLTKKEVIQADKQILVRDRNTQKVYAGDNGRKLLGLPNTPIAVNPISFGKFDIFVQSNSVNRKLVPNTEIIVLN